MANVFVLVHSHPTFMDVEVYSSICSAEQKAIQIIQEWIKDYNPEPTEALKQTIYEINRGDFAAAIQEWHNVVVEANEPDVISIYETEIVS